APGTPYTTFHGTQRLSIGMSTFKTSSDQLFPNKRKVIKMRTEEVDTLSTCDLSVKAIFLSHLPYNDEFFRLNLSTWHPRHNRVGSSFLYICQKTIIAVLSYIVSFSKDHFIPKARKQGGY